MARLEGLAQILTEQNGRKKFIKKQALSTSGVLVTIGTTDVDGNTIPAGATIVLQGSGDFLYEMAPASVVSTRVTQNTSTRPGIYVTANQQEYVTPHGDPGGTTTYPADTQIDVIAATGTPQLNIYWVS